MKAVIYVVICLSLCTELIQCSCLSYGHSCWGAHGKRASIITSHRVEMGSQPDRWALFKIMQDENDNLYRRERNIRISQDDSLDVIEKAQDNLIQALNKQNLPLVIVNPAEENANDQQDTKTIALNQRKRRSGAVSANQPDHIHNTEPHSSSHDNLSPVQNFRLYRLLVA